MIAYANALLGRFSADASATHWAAVKPILSYRRETQKLRIRLRRGDNRSIRGVWRHSKNASIIVYAEADFAREVDGMQSTSGFVILHQYRTIIHWRSEK